MGAPVYREECQCIFRTRSSHLLNFLDQMIVRVRTLMPGTPPMTLLRKVCDVIDVGDVRFNRWARTEAHRWRHFMTVHPTSNPYTVVVTAPPSNDWGGVLGVEC